MFNWDNQREEMKASIHGDAIPPRYEDIWPEAMDWFQYRGLNIRYFHRCADPAEKAILICNGIGQNIEVMAPLIEALNGVQIVMYDIPGTGDSDPTILPWTFAQHSKLALSLLDAVQIEHFIPLGVSWGGLLAQELARKAPRRVERLILASSPPGSIPLPASLPADYARLASLAFFPQDEQRALSNQLDRFRAPNPISYFYQVLALFGTCGLNPFSRLHQPSLILQGRDDYLVPSSNGYLMSRMIPNAELAFLEGGHTFMLTHPEDTARLVSDFLG